MRRKKTEGFLTSLLGVLLLLSIIPFTGYAAVPQTINYQGYLTDTGGNPVDGTVQMTFKIYNVASGGTALWTETQGSVAVSEGVYSVVLGSVTPINLAFDEQYYLGVQVEADLEMTPRQALTSVPYAFTADVAGYAYDVADGAVTSSKIATGAVGSTEISDDSVASADVGFNYAGSSSKGGPASDLNCAGCVSQSELGFTAGDGHSLDAADGSPTDAVYVDNDGNVGIGTIMPEDRLNVGGDVRVGLISDYDGSTESYGNRLYFSGGNDWNVYDSENSDELWIARYNVASDNTELRVNIGDNAQHAGYNEDRLVIGAFDFTNGDWTPRMVVSSGGNVGIGTTSPQTKLHLINSAVAGADYVPTADMLTVENNANAYLNLIGNPSNSVGVVFSDDARSQGYIQYEHNNNKMIFATDALVRLAIDSNGNVGIGDTSPAYKLEIGGGDVNTTGGGYRDSGACVAGTCASDRRLKRSIKPLSDSLEKIASLEPASFEFIDHRFGQGTQYGLVAQDVEKVFPEWVVTNDEGYKSIRYRLQIQMHLIQAVKELKAQNEDLRAKNQTLRQEIEKIKEAIGL